MRYILLLLWITGLNCQAQEVENVFDLEFYLPSEAESWYNKNYNKKIKSDTWTLGEIFNAPNNNSRKVGELITYYEPAVNNFILQFQTIDGSVAKEIRSIGDWGYGIHLNVIGSTEGFVRLPNAFLKSLAWIRIGNGSNSLKGAVSSFVEQIVSLPTISVSTYPSGLQQILERGNYVIEKYQGGSFIIRSEIPSDMPCGDDVEQVDLTALPRYELPIKNLINEDGEISIRVAYPRGC